MQGVTGIRRAVWGHLLPLALGSWLAMSACPAYAQDAAAEPDAAQAEADAEEAQQAEAAQEALQREMEAADVDARKHFQVGQSLYEAGRFEQAGEEFSESYRLSKRPQLLYNAYVAYRDGNDFPKAIEALRAYLEAEPNTPDRINLRARLKSMQDTVAQLEAAEAAEAAEAQRAAQPRIEVRRSWVPTALLAGGAGLVAVSLGTGVATLKKTGDLDEVCPGGSCPSSQDQSVSRARRLAVATDVLLFSGLAAAVTGLVLRLTGALDEEYEVPVAMGCDARGCGLSVRGRF